MNPAMAPGAQLSKAVAWVRRRSPALWRGLRRIPAVRHAVIRPPRRLGPIRYTATTIEHIVAALRARDIAVRPYTIDVAAYRCFVAAAGYAERYPAYYSFNQHEKSLEHYIAADLLALTRDDVYIDIASEGSPVPDIYSRLYGCTTYRQDISYPPGVAGDRIGGDAASLPLADGFATKMGLHCSFEHFERDSDVRFMHEIQRVLNPSGAVCIVPLYLFDEYAVQTDPMLSGSAEPPFDPDAVVYCASGWGNWHGRFYDAAHLAERVQQRIGDLHLTVYRVLNAKAVDPSCYVEFAGLISRTPPAS
jgi:hypothetical protein